MAALLAVVSSLLWGGADFLGGRLSRRHAAYAVILRAQLVALAGMVLAVLVAGPITPHWSALGSGTAAGIAGVLALGAFYRALAIGHMTVVAPIAATSVALPVLLGVTAGQYPTAGQAVGIIAAAGGTVLAVGPELRSATGRNAAVSTLLALVAAAGFGLVLVMIAAGSRTSVLQTLLAQRGAYVGVVGVIVLLAPRTGIRWEPHEHLAVAGSGAGDMLANLLYAQATRTGILPVISVLASLYPIVTALLAHRFDGERLRRVQYTGVAVAFLGVVLLTVG